MFVDQKLLVLGAKKIGFIGLPPMGCLPWARTLAGGLSRNCDQNRNNAAKLYNSKMPGVLRNIQKKYQGSNIIFLQIYDIMINMIQNPTNYGNQIKSHPFSRILVQIDGLTTVYLQDSRKPEGVVVGQECLKLQVFATIKLNSYAKIPPSLCFGTATIQQREATKSSWTIFSTLTFKIYLTIKPRRN